MCRRHGGDPVRDASTLPVRFQPKDGELDDLRLALAPVYREYTENVSHDGMAIALRTAVYCVWLCEQLDAKTACDFGSGFTSYALRWYAQNKKGVQVTSIDDNAEWLEKTGKFLADHDMATGELVLWDDIAALWPFDVVVYDFGGGEWRERWMHYALQHTAKACVFDDVMHDGHRKKMDEVCELEQMPVFGLDPWTRDRFHRYAALALR